MTRPKTKPAAAAASDNGAVSADFDFSHLDIQNETARYDMPLISPGAYLVLRPASEFNRAWRDAMLARSSVRDRMARVSLEAGYSEEDEKADREDDIAIFPGNVIVDWGGVRNRQDDEVPFSESNCESFLKALPVWQLNRLRLFAKIPDNFVKRRSRPSDNPKALVGN